MSQRRSQGLLCPSRFSPFQKLQNRQTPEKKGFIYNGLQAVTRVKQQSTRIERAHTESSFQVISPIPPQLLHNSPNLIFIEHRPAGHIVAPRQLLQPFAHEAYI